MQLTKEECLEALTEIKMFGSINIPLYALETIKNLIEEHFDNPPLKFEEIKRFKVVWDNKRKCFIQIDTIGVNKPKYVFFEFNDETPYLFEFEEGRYFRKEVEE